jgi:O-antigen/teichoic acid export membrane protein
MMLTGLVGFFAFADLGVGNGVLNRVTALHAAGEVNEQRRVMRAGYACTVAVGLSLIAIWLAWVALSAAPTIAVGHIATEQQSEVLTAMHLFVVLLAVNIPASLAQKQQLGTQCGHWVGFAQLGAALATLIGVPIALVLGGGLPSLVLGSLGMQVGANLVSTWLWRRRLVKLDASSLGLPLQTGRIREWHVIVSLLRTGSLFLILQLAAAFAFQSDSIVIAHQLGQQAYGDFAIVQRVFLAAASILLAGLAGLWPAIGEALARGDAAWVRQALLRGYAIVFVVMGTTCFAIAILMPQILVHWVSMPTPPPSALLTVLAVWTVMEALGNVSGVFLNAAGLLKAQIVSAVAMGITALIGKWFLVGTLGAWGAVLGTIAAYSVISLPMQFYLIRLQLRKN